MGKALGVVGRIGEEGQDCPLAVPFTGCTGQGDLAISLAVPGYRGPVWEECQLEVGCTHALFGVQE